MRRGPADADVAQALIHELLRTALWLFDITTSLLDDLPDNAFPGEDAGNVLLEMLAGSCRPSIDAVGEEGARAAIELAVAIRESVRDDLRAAAQLGKAKQVLL